MRYKVIINVLSMVALICGVILFTAFPVGYLMDDGSEELLFFVKYSILLVLITLPIFCSTRQKEDVELGTRECFLIVVLSWCLIVFLGAIPYYFVGGMRWIDCIFESASGFTTTGASVIDNKLLLQNGEILSGGLSDLPSCLLYWRAMTQWLGGIGIIVLYLAVMPYLGIIGKKLYNVEVSSADSRSLSTRINDMVKGLWFVYIIFSFMETLLLYFGGMSLFDAWCHTCATLATGGFSTKSESISAYNSLYIEIVIMVFMILGSTNFILHQQMLKRGVRVYGEDEEFRSNLFFLVVSAVLIALFTFGKEFKDADGNLVSGDFLETIRYSFFQVISIKTTTGFVTADYELWSSFGKLILLFLMLIGGCAGSTTSALKHVRFILLIKYSWMQLKRILFPHSLCNVTLNGVRVETDTLHKVLAFFFVYILTIAVGSLLLCTEIENDIATSVSAVISCLGNVGPALGKVGPLETYYWMSDFSKIVLSFLMVLGRLEIFSILVIFLPVFWKK